MKPRNPAILALEDGTIFEGNSFQEQGIAYGEIVFNTAMTGYQEILTDCSYTGQMIVFTYPHIGNTGTNSFDVESGQVWPSGVIVRSLSHYPSNWRSSESLPDYLAKYHCLMIGDIDTRALTQKIRNQGVLKGCIMVGNVDSSRAIYLTRQYDNIESQNLPEIVSTKQCYKWTENNLKYKKAILQQEEPFSPSPNDLSHVVVYDLGVKRSILRYLVDSGCKVSVVPATTDIPTLLKLSPDGVLFSNGPGNPKHFQGVIQSIRRLLHQEPQIPVLGICLGHQLLTLALGGNTLKMKFGHHGANHPVQDLNTRKVLITSQNHNFMIDEQTIPPGFEITHRSLFDNTPQGIRHCSKPIWGFQGHPEASPGPLEAKEIFFEFIQSVKTFSETKKIKKQVVHA